MAAKPGTITAVSLLLSVKHLSCFQSWLLCDIKHYMRVYKMYIISCHILSFCFLVCVCSYVFKYEFRCSYLHVCEGQSQASYPMALHCIFWGRVSHCTWSSQNWLHWLPCAAPEPQGSACLPLRCCNSQTHAAMLWFLSFFCVFSEIFLRSLCLHAKYFTWPNPVTSFLFFPLFTQLLNSAFLSPPRCTLASRHDECLAAF